MKAIQREQRHHHRLAAHAPQDALGRELQDVGDGHALQAHGGQILQDAKLQRRIGTPEQPAYPARAPQRTAPLGNGPTGLGRAEEGGHPGGLAGVGDDLGAHRRWRQREVVGRLAITVGPRRNPSPPRLPGQALADRQRPARGRG